MRRRRPHDGRSRRNRYLPAGFESSAVTFLSHFVLRADFPFLHRAIRPPFMLPIAGGFAPAAIRRSFSRRFPAGFPSSSFSPCGAPLTASVFNNKQKVCPARPSAPRTCSRPPSRPAPPARSSAASHLCHGFPQGAAVGFFRVPTLRCVA